MTTLRIQLLAAVALSVAAPTLAGLPGTQPLQTALTGAPGCEHVLDLLLRYGPLEGQGGLTGGTVVPSPYGSFVLPAAEMGDLCLAGVAEVAGDPACPPTFVVCVTNNSCRAVCNVQVSLVALLGPIKGCDPTATACLPEIPPGATVEVTITLPVEALAMGSNGGAVVGFQKLLIAIDAFDGYAETNESNNLRLLCRAEIPQQIVEVVAPAVPAELQPAVPAGPPQATVPGSPNSIDSALEQFGLDTAGEAVAQRL